MADDAGLYLKVAGIAVAVVGGVWLWGTVAGLLFGSGWHPISSGSAAGVVVRLPSALGDPRGAWPVEVKRHLPGPIGFYAAGAVVLGGLSAIGFGVARVVDRLDAPIPWSRRRRRAPAARWARKRDLAPLIVKSAQPRRLTVGRFGHSLLATRELESTIVFSPTGTHKTSGLAIPALLEWEGPVLATSVKSDLVRVTLGRREALGDVMIFDPAQVTGMETDRLTPLHRAKTWSGAKEVAHWLATAARPSSGGLQDADFWYAAAEKLLGPLLYAAASSGRTMEAVVRWLDEGPDRNAVQVEEILESSERDESSLRAWGATQNREERQRSSIYTTAEMILAAFGDPRVIEETAGADYTPEWLLDGGANTLFLCAPRQQQDRLQPVFATVIQELMAEVEAREMRTGEPLDPPLLILLEECANIAAVPNLDSIASTARGFGVLLLTIFQDLSQVRARWGARADSIVNNHRVKIFGVAISDLATLELVARLLGAGEFEQRSRSTSSGSGNGRSSETQGDTYRDLAPPHVVRERGPGSAVLVNGELPAAEMMLRLWFQDRGLQQLRHGGGRRDG